MTFLLSFVCLCFVIPHKDYRVVIWFLLCCYCINFSILPFSFSVNCSVALATKENLQSQRGVLHGVTSRLSAVTSILFIIQFTLVFLIFLSMNVILSCLPLKDRLAFVYCHGHYHEMSWFFYPIFWFKQVETPRHICEKSYNYYQYYYEYYHQNYSLLLLLLLLEVLTRDFS